MVATTWPEIFRRAEEMIAAVVFVDESGIQSPPNLRRSRARTGAGPVVHCLGRREKVSVISGVNLEGELVSEVHRQDMTGTEVIPFLALLIEEIPGKLVVR